MSLTVYKINELYARFKKKARYHFNKSNYNKCILYLTAAGYTGYHYYLGFKDDEMEDILSSLSKQLTKKDRYFPIKEKDCVFYDSFSSDSAGLTQQYLDAIMSLGLKITYITEVHDFLNFNSDIKKQLEAYSKAEIIVIPSNKSLWEKSQFVYDTIIETKAGNLFIHSKPYSAFACVAFYGLSDTVRKYKINLTDRTFWLGTRFIDYSFEFRQFGWHLSVVHRGIQENKILCLPYYPIINKSSFEGFPNEAKGKIVLFSGASYYKIFDKDDIFFKMSRDILNACPEVVLLFAGNGNKDALNSKLDQYGIKNRFIPIGRRTDIAEVFKHSDIYLNTYPVGGGLMLLYAAQMGKPIVCYRAKTTAGAEDIVCQKHYYNISDDDIPSLVKRMQRLVREENYRRIHGEKIKECIVNRDTFNSLFAEYFETGENRITYEGEVNYERHSLDINDVISYDIINKEFQYNLSRILGVISLWECPSFFIDFMIKKRRFVIKKLSERISGMYNRIKE